MSSWGISEGAPEPSYSVSIDEISHMVAESDLAATGRVFSRDDFYDGSSIKVAPQRYLSGGAMKSFCIKYDAQAFEKSQSEAIWGPIWITLGDDAFPEENWNDMPVALLNEFARAATQMKVGSREVVRFFDGPLSVIFE